MSSRDIRLLQRAADYTYNADGEQKVAAFVTDKKGNVISKGVNSYTKTHPMQAEFAEKVGQDHRIYLHAEISALVKARKKPFAIYIARKFKNDEFALAKPCPVCAAALKEAGVKKIVYSNSNGAVTIELYDREHRLRI